MVSTKMKVRVYRKSYAGTKVVASLRPVKSPSTNKVKAFRLVAVIPNKEQHNIHTGEDSTSFRQKFHLAWCGDWIKPPPHETLERFERALMQFPICAKIVEWE